MKEELGFCVIYRVRVRPGKESAYVEAWSRFTQALRNTRGSLGSRLHRGDDGIWYAYAQWPSAEARRIAFSMPSADQEAEDIVRDAISEYFPEIILEPIRDHLARE